MPHLATLALIQYPKIDPVVLQLGPIAIRWYGLAYLTGFILGYAFLRRLIRLGQLKITHAELSDLVSYLVLGVLLGGRLGWWLFYHVPKGPEPWYECIAIWHGGMSFHGGLAGVLIAISLWSKFNKAPLWNVTDAAAVAVPIGLFFGRIANFVNGELWGRPTTVPWAMIFPNAGPEPRHPSQLYEALLEGPLLFLIMLLIFRKYRQKEGITAAFFLITYALFRFLVEFVREPDSDLGMILFNAITMGQILSAAIGLGGLLLLWRRARAPAAIP